MTSVRDSTRGLHRNRRLQQPGTQHFGLRRRLMVHTLSTATRHQARKRLNDPTSPHDDDAGLLSARTADGADDGGVAAVYQRQAAHAPRGSRTETVRCSFAHDATHFMCSLCRFSSRHFSDLRRYFAVRHREVTLVALFHANCTYNIVFPSRAATTKHATQCRYDKTHPISAASAANLSATANNHEAPAAGSGCPPWTEKSDISPREKRRRLTPPSELQKDDPLMIPDDDDTSIAPASKAPSPIMRPATQATAAAHSPTSEPCNQP
jgi:hypothetical protein